MTPAPEVIAAARASQRAWRIPACVSIAQYALESAWGAHSPGNNCFGIKQLSGYASQTLMTSEVIHGHVVRVPQKFAKFRSIAEAFDAHAKLLATSRYYVDAMKHTGSVDEFIAAMAPHYATDPRYGSKLLSIISGSNLRQYDL